MGHVPILSNSKIEGAHLKNEKWHSCFLNLHLNKIGTLEIRLAKRIFKRKVLPNFSIEGDICMYLQRFSNLYIFLS